MTGKRKQSRWLVNMIVKLCWMIGRLAQSPGISVLVIGTVGILVKAKRIGAISSLRSVLDDLEANGFYLSGSLKEEALRLAGE